MPIRPCPYLRRRRYWLPGIALNLCCFQEKVEGSVVVLPEGGGGDESKVSVSKFVNILQENAMVT